jgi:hypothetical protein
LSPAISKPAATLDGSGVDHGFLFDKQGKFSLFDVPGMGTGADQGTIPLDNSNSKAITGEAIDGSNVVHGFLVEGLKGCLEMDKPAPQASRQQISQA